MASSVPSPRNAMRAAQISAATLRFPKFPAEFRTARAIKARNAPMSPDL
jgi:hypothetical protein